MNGLFLTERRIDHEVDKTFSKAFDTSSDTVNSSPKRDRVENQKLEGREKRSPGNVSSESDTGDQRRNLKNWDIFKFPFSW